ncbi:MAG: chromosomal replication initiator protein DnaA [Neisseriaceae bacterium]|nr:MAG: chromosomal replication initiator protein DnaA [Neisseriaceae bacterium]
MEEFTNFWAVCITQLEKEMSEYQFNTWIPLLTTSKQTENWLLFAPTQFILNLVRENCLAKINTIKNEMNPDFPPIILKVGKGDIKVIDLNRKKNSKNNTNELTIGSVSPSDEFPSQKNIRSQDNLTPVGNLSDKRNINTGYEHTRLKPDLTFENLVVGKSNRIAANVGAAIADAIGKKDYNPFFVYGSTGLGKTHLAQAVANRIFFQGIHTRIRCIHAERFINDFIKHVRRSDIDGFKKSYKGLDLLILDDVQFIAGKERTMEEFFYLFNDILDKDKQIILTSDRLPSEIDKMDKRLISRFSCGLTVEIEPPELEMRVAILHKKAESANFRLPDDIAFFIAQSIKSNVRDLEGALNRVKAHSKFVNEPLTIDLVKSALKDILAIGSKQITVAQIQEVVANYYNIKVSDIKGNKRTKKIVRPRQVAMSLAKELTEHSLPFIGDEFGGKDHTTVIHSHKTIMNLRTKDYELEQEYKILINILNS